MTKNQMVTSNGCFSLDEKMVNSLLIKQAITDNCISTTNIQLKTALIKDAINQSKLELKAFLKPCTPFIPLTN